MASVERILRGVATKRDFRNVAKGLEGFSRKQLKAIHEAATGEKVFGLKSDIVEKTREALAQ